MILTFTIQKNGLRGKKIVHKTSGEPILCPKASLLHSVLRLQAKKNTTLHPPPPYPTPLRLQEGGGNNTRNDLQDPQYFCQVLRPKPGI